MMKRAIAVATLCVAGVTVASCGSGGPTPDSSGDPYAGRGSSVGDGLATTPPDVGEAATTAAEKAGCAAKAWPADPGAKADGTPFDSARTHDEGTITYSVSLPPTSGPHSGIWANWGFYDQPIPPAHQVHNLEHGGVIVHYGSAVSAADIDALKTFWRDSPAYVIVVPDTSTSFPKNGVVVTSWQRWMVCKPFKASQIPAIKTYRDTFRGTGPENVEGEVGFSRNSGNNAPNLPKPALPDPKA